MMFDQDKPAELVAAWDAGDMVPSIQMGGIGPGYEQAIQVLVIELLRAGIAPGGERWGDDVVRRIDNDCLGFSGAQVAVAKNLAANVFRRGMRKARQEVGPDRWIIVSNKWPRVTP